LKRRPHLETNACLEEKKNLVMHLEKAEVRYDCAGEGRRISQFRNLGCAVVSVETDQPEVVPNKHSRGKAWETKETSLIQVIA
jgi:hypothetical protein